MRTSVITMLIFSLVVMPTALTNVQAAGQDAQVRLLNIELSSAGTVAAQLLDEHGRPQSKRTIEFRTATAAVQLQTNDNGVFMIKGSTGGNAAVIIDDQAYAFRMWAHGTAPPGALTTFNIVHANDPVVRGQGYDDCGEGCGEGYGGRRGRVGGISGGQWLGLGLLAAAVVAIVLVANDDDDASN
ncbi:MAG: hypothetical protein R3C59_07390 [Planctomycetaceae bacterium]